MGKIRPVLSPQTGMYFPAEAEAENTSHSEPSDWDALSQWG